MDFYDVYHGVNEMVKELSFELVRMSDEHMAEVREAKTGVDSMTDEELLEHGLVRMPKDADGEYIHVGDVLTDGEYTFRVDELAAFGDGSWSIRNEDGNAWAACDVTHRHEPTVEDVLREFTDEVWNRCCEGATASDSGIDELVAECAAKLRLAGDGE